MFLYFVLLLNISYIREKLHYSSYMGDVHCNHAEPNRIQKGIIRV